MIKYFITGFFRRIRINKVNFFINILGLALGLAVGFIVLIFILNETSYDSFNIKKDSIYRVLTEYPNWKEKDPYTPFVLGPTLLNEFPEIENFTRIKKLTGIKVKKNNSFIIENSFQFADNSIFKIFSLPFIYGNPQKVLNNYSNVVVTKKTALKYFNTIQAVGKNIRVKYKGEKYDLVVSGVIKDIPKNSTFQADFIGNISIPLGYLKKRLHRNNLEQDWVGGHFTTYISLKENITSDQLNSKLVYLSKKHSLKNYNFVFILQKLTDIYLYSTFLTSNNTKTGSLTNIYIFGFIAILILIISASNSIILYIAQSSARYKEFGIRKIYGSDLNLRKQIFTESVLMSFIALPVAIIIMLLLYQDFNDFFDNELFINFNILLTYIFGYVLLTLAIGVISGGFVTAYFLKLNTVDTLKNKLAIGKRKLYFSRILMIIQIIIFSGLFVTLLFIIRQINFLETESMGFNSGNLIIININPDEFKHYSTFKKEIENIASVINVTGGWGVPPTDENDPDLIPAYDDPDREVLVDVLEVDDDFNKTYQIPLIEGDDLIHFPVNDSVAYSLINESGVKSLGLKNPIGKTLDDYYKIVGVLKDFYVHSMHEKIKPLLIYKIEPKWMHEIVVRFQPGQFDEGIKQVEAKWKEFSANTGFEYNTVQHKIEELYVNESKIKTLLSIFVIIGLIISSLGLFGLSLFIAKRRSKEIAIRKIYGASVFNVLEMMLGEFVKLSIIANIIAWIIAYFFISRWLENFYIRISILNNAWIFVLSGIVSVTIVVLSVGIKSYRAAISNPVDSLIYE